MMHAETNYIRNDSSTNRGGRLRLIVVLLAALALATVVLVARGTSPKESADFGAPPADHPSHLSDQPAPETAPVPLAATTQWELHAQGHAGKICEIVDVNGHGSGSACSNPQETEALGLAETGRDGDSVHLLSGWTVAQAKTIVLELADGSSTKLEALGHPTLANYKFFVTDFRPDVTSVVAIGANGQEVARASAQTMRFLTER